MSAENSNPEKFRSATEFPKTINGLDSDAVQKLYIEMRDCLIFTNRSRAQLIRHNENYKGKVLQLQTELQNTIQKLTREKELIAQDNQLVINELQQELSALSLQFDELTSAFEDVEQLNLGQNQMSLIAQPQKFFRFLNAVRRIVGLWRSDRNDGDPALAPSTEAPTDPDTQKQNPQMYTDPASLGRSLLDR